MLPVISFLSNLWKPGLLKGVVWEQGSYLGTNGTKAAQATRIRDASPISVASSRTYFVKTTSQYVLANVFYYQANGTYISYVASTGIFTTPANCGQITLTIKRVDGANILPSEVTRAKPRMRYS